MESRIALIDGDSLPYKLAYVAEKNDMPFEQVIHLLEGMLTTIKIDTNSDEYIIFLSGRSNFRNDVAKIAKYKGGRKVEKPKFFYEIRKYMKENYHTFYVHGAEADDLVAIYQTQFENTIICSDDKDLLQVPGYHYNMRTKEIREIDEEEGNYRLYLQLLTGDRTDNIKGIEGIGPAKAKKILEAVNPDEYQVECLRQYVNKYGEDGIRQCKETYRLIYMMRETNIELPKAKEWK